jgi:hypothetical protein
MSLRNSLRIATELQVASPKACNTQLSGVAGATDDATSVQQTAANPHECWACTATHDATTTQPEAEEACNSDEKLHVARTRECNTQLGGLTAHRRLPDLIAAIGACCDARGDDNRNRAALIAEAGGLTPEHQVDATEHFNEQAAVWAAATGRGAT